MLDEQKRFHLEGTLYFVASLQFTEESQAGVMSFPWKRKEGANGMTGVRQGGFGPPNIFYICTDSNEVKVNQIMKHCFSSLLIHI